MSDRERCRECGRSVRFRSDGTAGRHDGKDGGPCPGAGRPPAGDPPCLPTCIPAGTVAWPAEYVRGQPHASTHVCDSPSHQAQAREWVRGRTGRPGVYRPFPQARRAG